MSQLELIEVESLVARYDRKKRKVEPTRQWQN